MDTSQTHTLRDSGEILQRGRRPAQQFHLRRTAITRSHLRSSRCFHFVRFGKRCRATPNSTPSIRCGSCLIFGKLNCTFKCSSHHNIIRSCCKSEDTIDVKHVERRGRHEKTVEVAGPTGGYGTHSRSACFRSCATSGRVDKSRALWSHTFWPAEVGQREKKDALDAEDLDEHIQGAVLPRDLPRWRRERTRRGFVLRFRVALHRGVASFARTNQRSHSLSAQGRRDVEVEDGVGDERPTYVPAGAAKQCKACDGVVAFR